MTTIATSDESSLQPDRSEQLFEVSVFLFLIVPSMALSFFAIKQGDIGFMVTAIATILRDLALVCLILFFVWHNREAITSIGWTFRHGWKDIALGTVLFVPVFIGAGILDRLLVATGFSAPATPQPSFLTAQGTLQFLVAFVLVVVVAVAEETIFRGYLILRFRALLSSTTAAVVLSAVVFSLGHGYEGTSGVVTVGVLGAVYAVIYLWRKSLVAPITMHFLQDFLGVILIPLLTMRQ
jgi:membrane protease YdiL (CAAX protease family)